jgi:hypothetical protein
LPQTALTTNTTGFSVLISPKYYRTPTNLPLVEIATLIASSGNSLLTSPSTIFIKLSELSGDLILPFFNSCTIKGYVLGILVEWFTSITRLLMVVMYIFRSPRLSRGLSSRLSRHWCVISGRYSPGSRLSLFMINFDGHQS